ncbi:MAG: hypothetical protein HYY24_23795 [Verrucomicrobia bacterium]|nr:hypothetical protein [Verrucomicrobiota bacterium]
MMTSNRLSTILLGLLFALSVFVAGLSLICVLNVRTLNRLQARAFYINNDRAVLQALLNDCVEYSRRNPAMEAVLQYVGVKPKQAATQPPAKAPSR